MDLNELWGSFRLQYISVSGWVEDLWWPTSRPSTTGVIFHSYVRLPDGTTERRTVFRVVGFAHHKILLLASTGCFIIAIWTCTSEEHTCIWEIPKICTMWPCGLVLLGESSGSHCFLTIKYRSPTILEFWAQMNLGVSRWKASCFGCRPNQSFWTQTNLDIQHNG